MKVWQNLCLRKKTISKHVYVADVLIPNIFVNNNNDTDNDTVCIHIISAAIMQMNDKEPPRCRCSFCKYSYVDPCEWYAKYEPIYKKWIFHVLLKEYLSALSYFDNLVTWHKGITGCHLVYIAVAID